MADTGLWPLELISPRSGGTCSAFFTILKLGHDGPDLVPPSGSKWWLVSVPLWWLELDELGEEREGLASWALGGVCVHNTGVGHNKH